MGEPVNTRIFAVKIWERQASTYERCLNDASITFHRDNSPWNQQDGAALLVIHSPLTPEVQLVLDRAKSMCRVN